MKSRFLVFICFSFFLIISSFELSAQAQNNLSMASGFSEQGKESLALKEASAMTLKSVKDPSFVFVLSRSGYDFNLLSKEISTSYPTAKVFGMSVQHAVFTREGIHRGDKSAVAVLAMQSFTMSFGVGSSLIKSKETVASQVTKAIEIAIADAKKNKTDKPSIVVLGSTDQYEEAIVETVTNYFGKSVQIIGGTTVKEDGSKGTIIANKTVVSEGFGIALVYAPGPVGAAFHSGFISKKETGVVTSADGRIIKEIDGKPAFDVYQQWTSPQFDKLDISKSPNISLDAAKLPLAKSIKTSDGSIANIVAVPFIIFPDKSMQMGIAFQKGDTVSVVTGSPDALILRAGTVAKKATISGKIKLSNIAGGFQIYCIGAALIGVGEKRLGEIPQAINKEMGEAPYIGGFFGGEQGTYSGFGSCHANLTSDMVVFSK